MMEGGSNLWGKLKEPAWPQLEADVNKASVRQRVWEFMERNDLAAFPRPVYHRVPNFRGAAAAGHRVALLPEFAAARTVCVGPDKPQEEVRYHTLLCGGNKALVVPTPRLSKGLFNRLLSEPGASKEELRRLASRSGIDNESKPVPIAARIKVDLFVVGAVAVDRLGRRVGKGDGFADLEFAMASVTHGGAVGPDTLVVATVHDVQVFDYLPAGIFGEHDLTVDVICTPTEVFRVQRRLPKPGRIIWGMLTKDKFAQIEVLREIQYKEKRAGRDVRLKDEEPEQEEEENLRVTVPKKGKRKVVQNGHAPPDALNHTEMYGSNHHHHQNGGRTNQGNKEAPQHQHPHHQLPHQQQYQQQQPKLKQPRVPNAESVTIFLGRIPKHARLKDLQESLEERGVTEVAGVDLVWKGMKGFAFINIDEKSSGWDHDDLLLRLKGLRLQDTMLNVQGDKRRRSEFKKNGKVSTHKENGAAKIEWSKRAEEAASGSSVSTGASSLFPVTELNWDEEMAFKDLAEVGTGTNGASHGHAAVKEAKIEAVGDVQIVQITAKGALASSNGIAGQSHVNGEVTAGHEPIARDEEVKPVKNVEVPLMKAQIVPEDNTVTNVNEEAVAVDPTVKLDSQD